MDKDKLKKEIIQLLQNFFQEEQGNRITSNNIEGFSGKLLTLIDKQPEKKNERNDSKDK